MFDTITNVNFGQMPRPAFGRAAQHTAMPPPPCRTRAEARYQRAAKTAEFFLLKQRVAIRRCRQCGANFNVAPIT